MNHIATTLDALLNQRVELEQPAKGYRVAIDTVLLASACPALPGDRVLDMGCGVGGAFLCLAYRINNLSGLGIELQSELVDICKKNIQRNRFASGFDVREGDIKDFPSDLKGSFDHVLINPPYHEEQKHDLSVDQIKRTANSEKPGDLSLWIKAATDALKPVGALVIIHRYDRKDEILSLLSSQYGEIEYVPLLPKKDHEAKRIVIRARKGGANPTMKCLPLTLHKEGGGYTEEAEDVLRYCQALIFQSP